MDPRIQSALDKLEHGGWSLTVAGFARKALKMRVPMSVTDRKAARSKMVERFGEPRAVPVTEPGARRMIEVWDFQK